MESLGKSEYSTIELKFLQNKYPNEQRHAHIFKTCFEIITLHKINLKNCDNTFKWILFI